jgi:hypothetical protein
MSPLGTRNHIDCGAAGQLCNQRPAPARRRGSRCTSTPAPQRLLSEDNETRSIGVPFSIPGAKPISRSAQGPAGDLSQSLRETTCDKQKKHSGTRCRTTTRDYGWSATTSPLDGTYGGFPSTEPRSSTCVARVVPPFSWNCAKAQRAE